ncbi:hypothetical protein N5U20_04395 [Aliarcobacter butzleri]|uniref:hypothetical protein n=1 Tax=Aliarcobacter TaxID=2321111 RepID=UPI0021B25347|nr:MULTISPECIES: hypothetical protein [Aliarcobacter]MCT7542344.1 hypothetical protein [Aliarcobacter cryaerophilus]MCT7612445.1 hypothetical protein [Aliarcobacter butzleri]MCT7641087.1 hypothetical protein [Aliarcobacter butzleri]
MRYLAFEEARTYVRNQKLENTRAWKKWSKGILEGKERRPDFIPASPDIVYKNSGWLSWSDWISENIEIDYLPFEEARDYVRSLNLTSAEQWQRYYQDKIDGLVKPDNIPWNPQKIYAEQWNGIKDWIGTDWKNFEEAREFVRNLGLNGQVEWRLYCKNELNGYESKPLDIPTDPKRVYEDNGWIDMSDWLGTERKRRTTHGEVDDTWLSYEDAKEYVHSLKLSSYDEWKAYIDNRIENLPLRPMDLPKSPQYVYKNDGWRNWSDWLGNNAHDDIAEQKHIIIQKLPNADIQKHKNVISFNLEQLMKEYQSNTTITKILSFLANDNNFKSIIDLDLRENEINEIEKVFFKLRGEPTKLTYTNKAFVGLVFLTYVIYKLESNLSYSSLWKAIISDLEHHSTVTRHFLDSYFTTQNHPNLFLKESIEYACNLFNLRNNFDVKDEQQYVRNTILLQIGLLNKSFEHLKLWLSNYNLPVIVSELLDVDSKNYSKEFNDGWRVLRRFRDNILSNEQAKNILTQNIWFKHLNLDELLKAAKQRAKKQLMITQDEDLPVFYLEKINYSDDGLSFTINAQDLYSLNLSGFRYEIYIDDEYKGVLIANNSKELILESPITIFNPDTNQIDLELRNEDDDVAFATEIVLFDFTEQMVLFDEDGNIYQNIFKKLNAHKKYHILIDSDLDCDFNDDFQREYFDGYATLVPFIGYKDNCKITYNEEILFELNFTENVEKPEFIDQLVLYTTANPSFILNNEYTFELKIMQIDSKTEEVDLKTLPSEAKIIKWSYLGGYSDSDDIENNSSIKSKLYPEMITSPKHTLLIKYKNRVFKKIVYCNFFEKQNQYRLFQMGSDATVKLVDRTGYLTKSDLKKYRYYLSDFSRTEQVYIKNKSSFYQTIRPNKIINFAKFDGFGETIFIAEHLFNSPLISLFDYRNSDEYISINQEKKNEIFIHRELPQQCKLILLDQNLKEYEFQHKQLLESANNHEICFDNELVSVLVIQGNSVVDSSYDNSFLDSFNDYTNTEVIKNLLVSNYPFLSKQSHTNFLRKFIMHNIEEFFSIFYNDRIIINENLLKLDFSKINLLIEHVLFSLKIDAEVSERILQRIILESHERLMLDTPIILFKLLLSCGSNKLKNYFYNLVNDAELEDDRDESFIELIINNLFDTTTLSGPQKHNLKVAMHYINGPYYLKKALEKLNG